MSIIKRILSPFLANLIEEITIDVLCFDTNPEVKKTINVQLHSYPPIGSVINIENGNQSFQIESLEIQGFTGRFCVAKGFFIRE